MFLSAGPVKLTDDHLDLSFNQSGGWSASEFSDDMRSLTFAIGDAECGPMVMLASISVRPGDEEKFPPIVHMHRADSFRTIFNGDFYVGRKIYADGAARLQASGAYYGPEQPGPDAIRDSRDIWSLLVFGDKRGHRVHPADKKYMPMMAAGDAVSAPFYEQLGVVKVLPEESKGETDIRTNLDLKLSAGHADLAFDQAKDWPLVGDAHVATMSIGPTRTGPLVLGLSAKAGAVAAPAAAWDTEVVVTVIHGALDIGGRRYGAGDVRVQAPGAPLPAMVAGPEGVDAYVVIGDRRGARPLVDPTDAQAAEWAREMETVFASFARPSPAAAHA